MTMSTKLIFITAVTKSHQQHIFLKEPDNNTSIQNNVLLMKILSEPSLTQSYQAASTAMSHLHSHKLHAKQSKDR